MAEPICKVLDCQRKGILGLPSGAVHLWLAYLMNESEDNECYLSTRTLAAIMNVDRGTVMKWQQYLLANGWLTLTGGSAADKFEKPTRGASKVLTMRVDDPLKEGVVENFSHEEGSGNLTGGKIQPKVYGSGSVSSSRCVTVPATTPAVAIAMPSHRETFSLRSNDEGQNQEQHQGQNQNQKQNPLRSASAVKPQLKRSPRYDSPFPAEFDAWSVLARAEWVELHSVKATVHVPVPVEKEPVPAEPPTKATPVKPAPIVKPPKIPPPPAPVPPATETDQRLGVIKSMAERIYKLQVYYNAKLSPPADWETVWVNEFEKLYQLTEGENAYLPKFSMLRDLLVVSQVKHPTQYTHPALIAETVPALAAETLELIEKDELNALYDGWCIALGMEDEPPQDEEAAERKERDRQKNNQSRQSHWQKWIEEHEPVCA
jgi:hypothetical protein